METLSHTRLKAAAIQLLLSCGARAVAAEVRCPGSRYRADVAAYLDPQPKRARPDPPGTFVPPAAFRRCVTPRTFIIECKQSRSDYLRDTRRSDRLLAERERLERERETLENDRIKRHEPELRRSGTYLFPELEEWDFAGSRLTTYRRLVAALRRLDSQIYGETKLWTIARYRLADALFIAAPVGMIARRELPVGWGLLECRPRELRRPSTPEPGGPLMSVRIDTTAMPSRSLHQVRLLRNIAVAATRDSLWYPRGAGDRTETGAPSAASVQ